MSEAHRVIAGLKGIMANANEQAIQSQIEVGTRNGLLASNEAIMLFCQVAATSAVLQAEMLIVIHDELTKPTVGKKVKKGGR